jgi:ParE toxin of type II toxin-antitoxin system, parDE
VIVRILPTAKDDARRAGMRLEGEQRGFGSRFAAMFRTAISDIRSDPRTNPRTEDGPEEVETREYYIKVFEYRVVFAIWNEEAVVVAVIHAARRPGQWVPRLREIEND